MAFENAGGSRDPSLAWNPATDQFGLGFTGWSGNAAFAGFRRIGADGSVSGRQTFGFTAGTFTTGIEVNSAGQYILAWSLHPGTRTATFDAGGGLMAESFITSRFGHDQSLGLAYNPSTGSFLAVGSDGASLEVAGAEVNGGGGPNSGAQILTDGAGHGSFHPLTTARPGSNQWDVGLLQGLPRCDQSDRRLRLLRWRPASARRRRRLHLHLYLRLHPHHLVVVVVVVAASQRPRLLARLLAPRRLRRLAAPLPTRSSASVVARA